MKPYYIDLIESGERLYLGDAWEFNPNEYEWQAGRYGFWYDPERPNESYVYEPVFDPNFDGDLGECTTARTILFRAYDEAGNLICEDTDHVTSFWL